MKVKLDMPKLQGLVYCLNNAKISRVQMDQLHCVIVQGILTGEVDLDLFAVIPQQEAPVNALRYLQQLPHEGGWVMASKVYEGYRQWCQQEGLVPDGVRTFCQLLLSSGIPHKKAANGTLYFLGGREPEAARDAQA